MARNIVICCDGTGNEIDDNQTNVLKLYRLLKKSRDQLVYYDPGLGTLGAQSEWARLKQKSEEVAGLALGYGLDHNVIDAYRFLVDHYRKDDRIYLFGFSRGAYTVRVLAGFINSLGLIKPEQSHLAGYAFVAYKQISQQNSFAQVRLFEQALRPQHPPIRFLGLWDTVSSIIVPRRDRFYLPSLRQLPYTQKNPSVQTVRHALAVDEKRRMFKPYLWLEGQEYWGSPYEPRADENRASQDVQQVWFAGYHSDVGGGQPEMKSGLAKIALRWMIDESPPELGFVKRSVSLLVPEEDSDKYVAPNPEAAEHDSMRKAWPVLEYLPKWAGQHKPRDRKTLLGFYLPRSEPRSIPADAVIHPSVWERWDKDPTYRPGNLPPRP